MDTAQGGPHRSGVASKEALTTEEHTHMGVIGFDWGCRGRGSEPRNAAMISLTTGRKKIIANSKRESFALAA